MSTQDDFISTVSHELRTPLTSIRGFAQTMLSSWDRLDDESKKRFLQIIEQQSNRLIDLVENILSVNKIQSSELILQSANIGNLIDPILQIIRQQYPNHTFETKLNPQAPNILVDKDRFQQVMMNLIENAAKYSDENTIVTISADFSTQKDMISIKVIDKGIGINPQDIEKIFNKFSRIDNPLTRKVQGSGLGLYITKSLIEKMNGEIKVTSIEGNGSTFEVLLPFDNVELQARSKCSQKL